MDTQEETRNIDGCGGCIEAHTDEHYSDRACACLCHYTRAELESRIDYLDKSIGEAHVTIVRLTAEARPPASAELRALAEQNDKAADGAVFSTDAAMVRLIAIQNRALFMFADKLLRSEVGAPR